MLFIRVCIYNNAWYSLHSYFIVAPTKGLRDRHSDSSLTDEKPTPEKLAVVLRS